MMPKVSVIMPVYNGERYLAEAIKSIRSQTYADFEFIIVDDGSRDRSAEIINAHAEVDDRICVISHEKNVGQSAAINAGIGASTGKYVTGMDCDDVSLPTRLQLQLTFLQANPRAGAVGTQMQVVDDNMKPLFEYDVPEHHARILWNLFFGWSLAGATVMMRRELLVSLGGYDTSYRTAGDLDLWSRMAEITRFANLPDKLYVYRRHDAAIGVDQLARQRKEREWVVKRTLETLWGEPAADTVDRFMRVRERETQFTRAERQLLQTDLLRLIDSFVAAGWAEESERSMLLEVMKQRLKETVPQRRGFRGLRSRILRRLRS